MYDRSAEIDFALEAEGVPVVYGGVSVYGVPRVEEMQFLAEGSGLSTPDRRTMLSLREGALTGLVMGAAILVDGAPFEIRDCGFARPDGLRTLHLVATDAIPDAPDFDGGILQ